MFNIYAILTCIFSFEITHHASINQISFTVTENCVKKYVVGDMSIYRSTSNTTVTTKIYSMESLENEHLKDIFIINSQTGIISVNRMIDREAICPQVSATTGTCSVTLLVTILNDILNIIIIVVDENDNAPSFLQSSITVSIKESSPVGTKIYLSHAKDLDGSYNGIGDYSLTSEKGGDIFKLNYNSSVIYLESSRILDYEFCQSYGLTLSVCDVGSPKLCSSQNINVVVIDVNDNYPQFTKQSYLVIINEDHLLGNEVLQVSAIDKDSRQYGIVRYRFSSINNEAKTWFRLDSITGKVYLLQPLAIKIKNFKFVIEAFDNGPIPNVNRTLVNIHIKDINNHYPEIKIRKSTFPANIINKEDHRTEVTFYENNPTNTDIVFVVVTDEDSDDNGLVHCTMEQRTEPHFQLQKFNSNRNKVIYRLVALQSTNCEVIPRYVMIIKCSDSGEKPKVSLKTIEICILDANEFNARFNQTLYTASVKESTAFFSISMPIIEEDCNLDLSIEVIDLYAKQHFKYVMSTQRLVLLSPLDYETRGSLLFEVKVIDKGSDGKTLSSTSTVDITVIDINDNVPLLIDPKTFYVEEGSRIGITIGRLRANDSDQNQNARTQFQKVKVRSNDLDISSDYNSFFVTSDGSIKLAKQLDREKQEMYLLTIEVTDMGLQPLSSTSTITIRITDINDNSPQWVFPSKNDNKINESVYTAEGTVITRVHAIDSDGIGNNNITYHLLRENLKDFSLHPVKGELSFASSPRVGEYTLDIMAIDNGKPLLSNRTKLIIYISEKNAIGGGIDNIASRSYFTIVAVVPVLILICILLLILCLLLVVRRRNAKSRNRRNQLKNKPPENLSRKISNVSVTNEKLLKSNMIEMNPVEELARTHCLEALDLTQTKSLPKVSYKCLLGKDLDVCSADSGQGASEEDFSNYFMLKSSDNYRVGPCNQHCCSTLPENSIAHFICSTINHPILYPQPLQLLQDDSNSFPYNNPNYNKPGSDIHLNQNAYVMSCGNPSCNRL